MASKRERKVAFADNVDIENKKARTDDQPNKVKFQRSELFLLNKQELKDIANGNLSTL